MIVALGLLSAALLLGAQAAPADELAQLRRMQERFAPVELSADLSALPKRERRALAKIVEAARQMDALFLRQVWPGNEALLLKLLEDETPLGRARLRFFLTMKGPWDRQDHNRPFIPGVPPKPGGAGYYPMDVAKKQVESWIEGLPAERKAEAMGFFTTIRRGPDGRLGAVPYSVEYQPELQLAAARLLEAADLTRQRSLRDYLRKRAAAFISNDYYDSDVAWMELDASIEPTIGPYETYEDEWFGYKAAFEAFVTVRDDAQTEKLRRFGVELQWLEDRLPIDPKHRNPKLGALAPIRVVNQVYAAGDAASGVTTAAFNLPNDERVTREKGAKRTMLKNVQQAKFNKVLRPIAQRALREEDRANVDFSAFFTHILMHELMHGLGPHDIAGPDGRPATVRQSLKDAAGALEEAKADISGLWALQRLIDKGVIGKDLERTMYDTYLASSFRTLRFGISEAHGKGMALQVNYLLDRGAFKVSEDGTFYVDEGKIKGAVEDLTREIMTVQARGDYPAARALLEKLAVLRPPVRRVLERLEDIPVDIAPSYPPLN